MTNSILLIDSCVLLWSLNVLLQVSAIVIMALILARAMRHASAPVRYGVLLAATILVLLSPIQVGLVQLVGVSALVVPMDEGTFEIEVTNRPEMGLNATTGFNQRESFSQTPFLSSSSASASASDEVTQIALDGPMRYESVGSPARTTPVVGNDVNAADFRGPIQRRSVDTPMEIFVQKSVFQSVLKCFLGVWLMGSLFSLVRLFYGWVKLARLLRQASPIDDPRLARMYRQICRSQNLHNDRSLPRLVCLKHLSSPIAAGVFSPQVAIPTELAKKMTKEELRAILVHEVAHIARRDQFVVLLQNILAALFWMHPLIRRLNRELATAREEVCDNYVLAITDAASYSRTLLSLSQNQLFPVVPGAVGLFTRQWKLEKRVAGLLDQRRKRNTSMSRFALSGVILAALVASVIGAATTMTAAEGPGARESRVGRVVDVAEVGSVQDEPLKSDGTTNADATLLVSVVDVENQSIDDAKLSIYLWADGEWKLTNVRGTTDQDGDAELTGIKPNQYSALTIQAEGYAPTVQDMELEADEKRQVVVKLKRPAQGTIRVQDQKGEPVVGAILSELNFNDEEGGSYFHRLGINDVIPFESTTSDANGIIQLPAMPEDAKVGLCVFHPDFVIQRVSDLSAAEKQMAVITLEEGIGVRFNLVPGLGTGKLPNQLQLNMLINPSTTDRERVLRLVHLATFVDGNWNCTLSPADYEILMCRSNEEWTITPAIELGDKRVEPLLTIRDDEPRQIDLMIRKNVKVRGKLIGDLSVLGPNSYVFGETENLHPSFPIVDEDRRWAPTSFVDIQPDGTFELSLPAGLARIKFAGLVGAVVEPNELEIKIEPGKDVISPETRVRRVSGLRGRLVDEDGKGIASGIARLFVGWNASNYVRCDEAGRFELPFDLVTEFANLSSKDIPVSVIGFDTKSNRSALVPIHVDLKTPMQELKIVCEPQERGWLIQGIREQCEHAFDATGVSARRNKALDDNRTAYPQGRTGETVPELTNGTWLNSDRTSLKELRGKYVLLDFWFIGCGPCKADSPNVKLCHEVLPSDRFTVVSVHSGAQQTVDNVRQYAEENGMPYPIVVESVEREISEAYKNVGVYGYPHYILIGPDGRIVHNDSTSNDPSLVRFKLETILSVLE